MLKIQFYRNYDATRIDDRKRSLTMPFCVNVSKFKNNL